MTFSADHTQDHNSPRPALRGVLRPALIMAALIGCLIVFIGVPGSRQMLLGVLPALLLFVSLMLGHRPGESLIRRLGSGEWHRSRHRPATDAPATILHIARHLVFLASDRLLRAPPLSSVLR